MKISIEEMIPVVDLIRSKAKVSWEELSRRNSSEKFKMTEVFDQADYDGPDKNFFLAMFALTEMSENSLWGCQHLIPARDLNDLDDRLAAVKRTTDSHDFPPVKIFFHAMEYGWDGPTLLNFFKLASKN